MKQFHPINSNPKLILDNDQFFAGLKEVVPAFKFFAAVLCIILTMLAAVALSGGRF